MTKLIIKIMEAKSTKELNEIMLCNWETFCENPFLFSLLKKARRRIQNINEEKMKSWESNLN